MESEKFLYHESGETVNKGWHGIEFEKNFGKFLLFRLICQRENFTNFRFTREKKGTGKFDDFVFAYDSIDGETKYSLFQLKHFNDENAKITFEDLKLNSKSYFGLPYYFDYYYNSLSVLSSDKDLKKAELDCLIFCTNVGIEDSLECISKREIPNEGLFRDCGKLYKISINEQDRREIFHEQFLSERKRLANELTPYVMENKEICFRYMINDDSLSLIQKFSKMLLDHVFDIEEKKFKNSFLDPQLKNINKEIDNFRTEFFDSLFDYREKFPQTREKKSKKFKSNFPTQKWNTEGFIEFLKERTINIKIYPFSEHKYSKILSEELVLSIMLQKTFDIKSNIPDQKSLRKFSKFIREDVIDLDAKKLRATFLCDNSSGIKELCDFRQRFLNDLRIFCEHFRDKNVKEIEEFIKVFNTHLNIQTFSFSLELILEKGENEVIEFLRQREIILAEFPDIETCTEAKIFPSGEVDTIKIDKNIVTFLNLVTFAVNQNNFENLLFNEMNKLITKEKDQMLLYKGFNNFMDTWYNEGVLSFLLFESKLKYRKWITEEELLNSIKNLNILFQNREVKLSDICSCSKIITPEVFMYNFTTSNIMNLGEGIDKSFNSFYININLVQSKKVNINSLLEESQDIIIVSLPERYNPMDFNTLHLPSIKLEVLQLFNSKHNYYYTKENFSFLDFFIKNKNCISQRNVHWITFLGKDFKYESSLHDHNFANQGSSENETCSNSDLVKKFLPNKTLTCLEVFENENFVIITGEPGSGKSIILKHLSIEVKNLNVDRLWVILITLNKYQKYLDKYDNFDNVNNILDFLAKIQNCENEFSRNVLRYFLYSNRLILLFDGFDEIHESGKQVKILGLLKFLKDQNLTKKIWITSRPHCVPQLEEILECVAFDVVDISEDDQIRLVINEWKAYHGNSLVNLIEENAKNFVYNINDDISTDERDFLGVPLQLYMFSHAYINESMKSSVFPQDVGLVQLFEDFIESKYNIFFKEKVKTGKILQNDFKNVNERRYQIFALRFSEIISPEDFNILSKTMDIELTNESIDLLKRIGLIYETSGVCTFIHETFAEYYIADLLLSITENCHDENVLKSVKSILLESENYMILDVFDTHLIKKSKGYKIQESIMNGDEIFIRGLNNESLSTVDFLGRNCFYYALQENQFSILSYLISRDIELSFEPFFVKILKDFSNDFVETQETEVEEIYLELFGYILEKEEKNGCFASECLDQCLRLDLEMHFEHWKIAAKLINKFDRKLVNASWYSHYVLKAPKEFFDAYLKLLDQDENLNWLNVLRLLLSFDTDRLKETIDKHKEFILRIPVCSWLLSKNYSYDEENCENFSSVVECIKRHSKNFSLLFKFLFESKDVSFEEFENMLGLSYATTSLKFLRICTFQDGNYIKGQPVISQDSEKSIHSLRVSENKNSYSIDLLQTLDEYMNICGYDENANADDAALDVVEYLLSQGDEEHVKRIFNICCSFRNLEKASQYWEEAKRTELTKYYKIQIKN